MKVVFWIAVLIGLYLLVSYYKGTQAIISTGGGIVTKLVLFLQGRTESGKNAGYAS
jgi:hypothetical protein